MNVCSSPVLEIPQEPLLTDPLTTAATKKGERNLAIDALRGIAAGSVVVLHYLNDSRGAFGSGTQWQFGLGNCGVQLFFMISGFVIFQSLDRRPRVLDFAAARFTRLYPTLWLSILIAYILSRSFAYYPDIGRIYPVASLTMMPRAFGLREYVPIHWTLYIELQFYVLMAALTALGIRQKGPWFLTFLVGFATAGAAGFVPGWQQILEVAPLLKQLHLFLFGICMYRWNQLNPISRVFILCSLVANTLVYGSTVDPRPYQGIPYHIPVFLLAILFGFAAHGRAKWLEQRWLIGLGTISYSLYLMHEPFGDFFFIWASRHEFSRASALAIAFPSAILLAIMATYTVEQPSQKILTRLWKRYRSQSDTTSRLIQPD